MDRGDETKRVAIACQGGGRSHTAFTAGVLKTLLKNKKYEITALSGPVQADGLSWIRVEVAGFTGWVATDNLREPANG